MQHLRFLILVFSTTFFFNFQAKSQSNEDARMLINLLDYIGKDYKMAVADGVVINEFEYEEMQDFSAQVQRLYADLSDQGLLQDSTIKTDIEFLSSQIQLQTDPNLVSESASSIKSKVMSAGLVSIAPQHWPSLQTGADIFQANCASCHGEKGLGDGPAGVNLNPAPSNLADLKGMSTIAPFQVYNTVKLGIPGTGMSPYTQFTEEELWAIAFYVKSLPYEGTASEKPQDITLEKAATLSEKELSQQYPSLSENEITALRTFVPEAKESSVAIAKGYLEQAFEAYIDGRQSEALNLSITAYLEGVEPIENQVRASDATLVGEIELRMMAVRSSIQSEEEASEIRSKIDLAYESLDEAEALIGNDERSLALTALIAGGILLREGLEAFLVILAIIGILKSMDNRKAIRWVHGGWVTAILVGLAGWFFTDMLLEWSAQSRELMEGLIALLAVFVLLYLGYWMHNKTEASKWKAFIEQRVKGLSSRNSLIGLSAFSFMVVFREAFESVLFLSSLSVDQPNANTGILIGLSVSALILGTVAWFMLKVVKRVPIRQLFHYSSLVVLFLAFVMTGEGIHAIQEGGFLSVHSFPINLRIGLIGIYPTWETISSQLIITAVIVVMWKMASAKSPSLQTS